ncbi:pyridine nucleotide-disulfide oxidoreductase [Sulfolobus sp. A20]|uniref:dihydrolipoyl dehydrogenase family protein n=1 Tax=Sulfolobaceae TaxID=118883 RepID=UPI000845D86B|nr:MULTISPECIES: NAD(P)/FAD-dependent oxidoreductase [unclassified Sulfolobus]TRM77047.1 NAD(P)/FAD-dependent oxidoreductase [Sulfolobus sp. A20-N-F8]TRM79404.1 NAD(P)/FAD-dependent oxidoreductase [Sulfolobus sp. B5]TRM80593.1 NAD(P)/FAD-dependent oxidoreductase [Sulfolobus sp. D5]TRM83742.1 NAD(P)/FAD-dependent oxidoreductase [Sulfolobus sp. A20-N-F6]TRM88456.1 NAD(P)/FAD-dependent oxidoreductase [Sulfolobus sp. C3]TRM99132.1 NAD(P)/FAD-dependent oxidoreductase [Sulfolobus sp. E1]
MEYDAVIVGGGTAGYVAGSVLARSRKKVLVVEKNKFGGVCVNYGCVPSIFLYDVTFLLNRLRELGFYLGLNISAELNENLFFRRNEIVEYLSNAGKKLIEDSGGDTLFGEAKVISPNEIEVDSKIIRFKKLIIASGSSPSPPDLEGVNNAINEDEAVNLNYVPNSMIVIGGGFAGVEISQFFVRLGSNVTLVTRSSILRCVPEDARKVIRESLEFDGIEIIENTFIKKIENKKVIINDNREINGEVVIYATGRKPNFPIGIEKLGLNISPNGIKTDKFRRALENVYAIGDVVDKTNKTAHSAMLDAIIASLHILGDNRLMSVIDQFNFKIPQVVYTDPQVGVVGDVREARKFETFPFNATTRAIIGGLREGYVKIGVNDRDEIVFGEVVGKNAEELINILTIAVNLKLSVEKLALLPFIHPSFSEAITNSAKSFFDLDVDRYKSKDELK